MTTLGACGLCLATAPLQHSHLLPRAIYHDLRTPGLADPNPITLLGGKTNVSQAQITAQLLCSECEQRFSREGENYVLLTAFRRPGKFRLFEMLHRATPLPQYSSHTVYSGLSVPGLEIDRLVYFGASVFWRASAATFRNTGQGVALVSLARYEEDFRGEANRYLKKSTNVGFSGIGSSFFISVGRDELYCCLLRVEGENQLLLDFEPLDACVSKARLWWQFLLPRLHNGRSRRAFHSSTYTETPIRS
jgi:hypothetical protein